MALLQSGESGAVSKKWYSYFVVTDASTEPSEGESAGSNLPTQPVRAGDISPETPPDASVPPAAAGSIDLATVYDAARITAPPHGYTILKVADMLRSEHLQALPADVKRKSIMVALDAAGVKVADIVDDAVRRDRALDAYERVLQKRLDELHEKNAVENRRLEEEIARRVAELRATIDDNAKNVAAEQQEFQAWQARKRQEETAIAEAVGHFVSENPISTTHATTTKGDADAR